ncbi:MAG: tail fiber domain-containing protein, partial [Bacteroidales bacterium]|nr:tail fiber domain-containing protein [Bacteroidales bacterium]
LTIISISYSQSDQYWSLKGNSATNSENFVGYSTNQPLIFKANNILSGFTGYEDGKYNASFGYKSLIYTSTGTGNSAFGVQALQFGTGAENTAVGHWALMYNLGSCNVAIGASSLSNSKGSYNTAIGQASLQRNTVDGNTAIGYMSGVANTTGTALTATGFKALSSNTTGAQNTANGFNALINNTTGANNTAIGAWTLIHNTTGNQNTAIGMKSLYTNTEGGYNTAIGVQAMEKNTTGGWNVACGSGALYSNTTGFQNTAIGTSSLWFNTTGQQNIAIGEEALAGNFDGSFNTAIGTRALWSTINNPEASAFGHGNNNTAIGYEAMKGITDGSVNIAIGVLAMTSTTTGKNNIAVGNHALYKNTAGSDNIVIGHFSNATTDNLSNIVVIGNNAKATSSNQVVIGNSQINSIRGNVNWTTLSDSRVKKNIKNNVPGLSFINLLQPVTFNLDVSALNNILKIDNKSIKNDQQITYSGFVAQDVESAAQSIGYDFSGVDPAADDKSVYGLRYAEFVVPLVKAVQELSEENQALRKELDLLKEMLEPIIGPVSVDKPEDTSLELLKQNFPNPFQQETNIQCNIPEDCMNAKLTVTDNQGRLITQIPIENKGTETISFKSPNQEPGIYFYSLYINDQLMDTKKNDTKKMIN